MIALAGKRSFSLMAGSSCVGMCAGETWAHYGTSFRTAEAELSKPIFFKSGI
jgi:hypothetical protein